MVLQDNIMLAYLKKDKSCEESTEPLSLIQLDSSKQSAVSFKTSNRSVFCETVVVLK